LGVDSPLLGRNTCGMARLVHELPAMSVFNFRLPVEEANALRALAKVTHAGNTSKLLRDMIESACSGNPERVAQFNERIFGAVGRQLTLDMVSRASPKKGRAHVSLDEDPAKARRQARALVMGKRGKRART